MTLCLTTGMPLQPCTCLLCGTTPMEDDGTLKRAIFAEGVDVDWGNSVYICWECGELIADLVGRVTRFGFDALTEKYEALKEVHADLVTRHEQQEVLVDKIREGGAAQRALKKKPAVAA